MQSRILSVVAVGLLWAGLAPVATAHGLDVAARWAPEVSNSPGTGAIYLRIVNESYHPEYLHRVTSAVATRVELHRTAPSGRMTKVDQLEIPYDDQLDMRKAGYHLMLIGLKRRIEPGETVPLELTFSDNQIHKMNVSVPLGN